MSRVAVITVVHGRHDHLRTQERSLARSERPVDVRVRVAMDDADLPAEVVVDAAPSGRLPLAAARNAGAAHAVRHGAGTLVFLDVDCLVAASAVGAYADAVEREPDVVWCGPVTYLRADQRPYPLDRLADLDDPHPARPAPRPGEELPAEGWELFWSLSFALSATAWRRTGGFDEAYTGYGAEDTDLGQRAAAAGLRLGWLGAARAYHQHHPTQDPPVQHLHDIVANARLFRERWGWWPMGGWLRAFADLGLVEEDGGEWRLATGATGATGATP